ncbi:hypothetical protein B0H14DRAFT_2757408 [Mycena olivaceomarginata]|nr:hypothetical protein B0H14DRAFT_2757408 [Mycena olivaceomarginata]
MSVVPSSGRSTDDHAVALGALGDGVAKLEVRRIKNRAAAASSRRRHRETFQALEARVAELETENAGLWRSMHMMQRTSPDCFAALISAIELLRTSIEDQEPELILAELSGHLALLLSIPHNTDPPTETRFNSNPSFLGESRPYEHDTIDPSLLEGAFSEFSHPQVQHRRVPRGMVRTASNSCSSDSLPASGRNRGVIPVSMLDTYPEGDLAGEAPTRFEFDAAENQPFIPGSADLDTLVPNLQLHAYHLQLPAQTTTDFPSVEHPAADPKVSLLSSPAGKTSTAPDTLSISDTYAPDDLAFEAFMTFEFEAAENQARIQAGPELDTLRTQTTGRIEHFAPSVTEDVLTGEAPSRFEVEAAQNQPLGMMSPTLPKSSALATQLPGPMYQRFLDGYPEFNDAITFNSDKMIVRSKGCFACAGQHPCVELKSTRRARACLTCAVKHVTCGLTAGEETFHPDTDFFIETHNYPLTASSSVPAPSNLSPHPSVPRLTPYDNMQPSIKSTAGDTLYNHVSGDGTPLPSSQNPPSLDATQRMASPILKRKRLLIDCVLVPKLADHLLGAKQGGPSPRKKVRRYLPRGLLSKEQAGLQR